MDSSNLIGSRLKEIRGALSQAAFASYLNVSQGTVGRYERDLRSPDADYILLLKKHFDINPNWLISGEGSKFISNGFEGPIYNDTISGEQENYSDEIPSPEKITQVVIEHQGIVKRFKNPEKGLKNNEYLLGIESASEDLYKKVSDYLKTTHETAKIIIAELKKASKKTPNENDFQDRKSS